MKDFVTNREEWVKTKSRYFYTIVGVVFRAHGSCVLVRAWEERATV
jgi:hypothetical protein